MQGASTLVLLLSSLLAACITSPQTPASTSSPLPILSTIERTQPSTADLSHSVPTTTQTPAFTPTATPIPPLSGSGGGVLAVASKHDGDWEIYLINADGSELRQLTDNSAKDSWPSWSPDGKQIVFMSDRAGSWGIYVMNADGSGQHAVASGTGEYEPSWSPKGDKIVYSSQRGGDSELVIMNSDGSEKQILTDNDVYDAWPAWSPDGEKIALISPRDGDDDIYIGGVQK